MRYYDSSAITRLLFLEPGTAELRATLEASADPVTSVIARIEVPRAVARHDPGSAPLVVSLLEMFTCIELSAPVVATAATLAASLRSGDAIHLASAMQLGPDLDAFVTYDARLAEAARLADLQVESPGVELALTRDAPTTFDPSTVQRVVDRLVGRLRPARILLPAGPEGGELEVVIVLGPWSPGRAASQLGREAVADLDVDLRLVVVEDDDADSAPPGVTLYEVD